MKLFFDGLELLIVLALICGIGYELWNWAANIH